MLHEIQFDSISNQRVMSSESLTLILSNEYLLYLQTLNFHWNITGRNFMSMHKLLEDQSEWLKDSIDNLAERIRALGQYAPAHYKKYLKDSVITEGDESANFTAMIETLCFSHTAIIDIIRQQIKELDSTDDYVTTDMLTKLLGEHEHNLWVLRSHLQE